MELHLVWIKHLEGPADVLSVHVRVVLSIYDIAKGIPWALLGIEIRILIGGSNAFEVAGCLVDGSLCSFLDRGLPTGVVSVLSHSLQYGAVCCTGSRVGVG